MDPKLAAALIALALVGCSQRTENHAEAALNQASAATADAVNDADRNLRAAANAAQAETGRAERKADAAANAARDTP